MPAICRSRRTQRGSIFILFTFMLMTVIIPLAGLAIDLTILYVVQAKLWESVDGAALEAGRLIGVPGAPIQALAVQACKANFPDGYWGATTPTGQTAICSPANITYAAASAANNYMATVTVQASATAPLLFMKVFQLPGALVASIGVASRRSVRVEVILDRSGSMTNVLGTVTDDVAAFTTKFNAGFDEMGFVTFSTSAVVGYPIYTKGPYDYNPNDYNTNGPATGAGPDVYFNSANGANSAGTTCCDMISQVNAVNLGGNTNTAEALSVAYIELQKAHLRDAAANGGIDPFTNNVIVFFTDGVPTGMTAYINSPDIQGAAMGDVVGYPVPYSTLGVGHAVLSPGNSLVKTFLPYPSSNPSKTKAGYSACMYNYNAASLATSNVYNKTTNPYGVTLAQAGAAPIWGGMYSVGAPTTVNSPQGMWSVANFDSSHGGGSGTSSWSYWWVNSNDSPPSIGTGGGATNCNSLNGATLDSGSGNSGYPDLSIVPPQDLYGNSTWPVPGTNGTVNSTNSDFKNNITTKVSQTGLIYNASGTYNTTTIGQQLAIGVWNAADNAGWNIRSDTTTMKVIIYTIGFAGDTGGCDDGLLAHIANDPATGTAYANTDEYPLANAAGQRQGRHFPASDTNAVADAFNTIAGLLLSLTR